MARTIISPLDDLLPIRRILVDGVAKQYARDLNFDPSFTVTVDNETGVAEIAVDASGFTYSSLTIDDGTDTITLTPGATAQVTTSRALELESTGATSDIRLDSARDVILDVSANGDDVAIHVAGVAHSTITPTAGQLTVAHAGVVKFDTTGTIDLDTDSASGVRIMQSGTTRGSIIPEGTQLRIAANGSGDIDIDSGDDIYLDVGADGDVIHIAAAGTDKGTITPDATELTIAASTGVDLVLSSPALAYIEGATVAANSAATIQLVAGTTLSMTAGADSVELSESAGALTLAPQDAALTIQPTAAAAGVGKGVTVKAGSGASGSAGGVASLIGGDGVGTNIAAGDALVYGGTPTGTGAVGGVRFGNGATYGMRYRAEFSGNYFTPQAAGGVNFDSQPFSYTGGGQVTLVSSLVLHQGAARRWLTSAAVALLQEASGTVAIASATTTTVASYTTESNRVYQVIAYITVSNDTDNEGAGYWLRAAFKNVAGTVTQIGATQTIAADLEDAGQTGLSGVLDFSGTAIRARLTTDAADTVNANAVLHIYERVLA